MNFFGGGEKVSIGRKRNSKGKKREKEIFRY